MHCNDSSVTLSLSLSLSISKYHFVLYFPPFLWWDWGVNSGLCTAKQVLYFLSHLSSLFFAGDFGDGGHVNLLPGLALNRDPS
jgi:hypothetical protein